MFKHKKSGCSTESSFRRCFLLSTDFIPLLSMRYFHIFLNPDLRSIIWKFGWTFYKWQQRKISVIHKSTSLAISQVLEIYKDVYAFHICILPWKHDFGSDIQHMVQKFSHFFTITPWESSFYGILLLYK